MGFYRHDQWGGCLPCWRYTVLNGGPLLRGWSPSRRHCYRINHQQRGPTLNLNAQTQDVVVHDVIVSVLWQIQFKWSLLNLKSKFKLHMLFKLAKLQMPLFVLCKPSWHVYDIPLMYKCLWLYCNGSIWNSIWINFELIPIKPNRKSYWYQFKINSNIAESCIFGYIIFSWSFSYIIC